jgi:hypothetical protein
VGVGFFRGFREFRDSFDVPCVGRIRSGLDWPLDAENPVGDWRIGAAGGRLLSVSWTGLLENKERETMCPQRWLEDWPHVWAVCFRRIRNWQVPPRWSSRDWWEEARAQAAIAAWQAYQDYDPAQSLLPIEAFLYLRVLASVRTRYRQEWGYGLHHGSAAPATGLIAAVDPSALVGDADLIDQLLESLKEGDRWLLRQLFWVGAPENAVAAALGISRQAVNKRKMIILKSLRKMVRNTS